MKRTTLISSSHRQGSTLLVVLVFVIVGFMVLGAALDWGFTNAKLNDRNNQYFTTVAAAEAATEKVLASIARDYGSQGESLVWANRASYGSLIPTASENPEWANFSFSDGTGQNNATYLTRRTAASYVPLQSQYKGIYGLASTYRIVSNARMNGTPNALNVGVRQDIQLASIPIFQFAIFYTLDLEINPGPDMTINGRVHGNANINIQPQKTLRFLSDVTAAGNITLDKNSLDPSSRSAADKKVIFEGKHDSQVGALTLPIGTNNTPDAVHSIVEVPPYGEDSTSAMGKQRYYNKTDMVIIVSNATVTVTSGKLNNFATTIPTNEWKSFLNTNVSFYNKREGKTVKTTEIDVSFLKAWSATNTSLRPALGSRNVRSIYVADFRTQSGTTESGVRVKNGKELPDMGLTVATPNPLYVQGHFNAPDAHLGTTNTSLTKPASLIGDSINILSSAWNDANSTSGLGSRRAEDTTINAAFLGGIVPSDGTSYSGGVENFPRFLEDWGSRTLAYNGSMVVMFLSKIATAPWGGGDVYSPPIRQWTFDMNFTDSTKIPPATPEVRTIIRAEWVAIQAGDVNAVSVSNP